MARGAFLVGSDGRPTWGFNLECLIKSKSHFKGVPVSGIYRWGGRKNGKDKFFSLVFSQGIRSQVLTHYFKTPPIQGSFFHRTMNTTPLAITSIVKLFSLFGGHNVLHLGKWVDSPSGPHPPRKARKSSALSSSPACGREGGTCRTTGIYSVPFICVHWRLYLGKRA